MEEDARIYNAWLQRYRGGKQQEQTREEQEEEPPGVSESESTLKL